MDPLNPCRTPLPLHHNLPSRHHPSEQPHSGTIMIFRWTTSNPWPKGLLRMLACGRFLHTSSYVLAEGSILFTGVR